MASQRPIVEGPGKFNLMVAAFNHQQTDFLFRDPSEVFPVRITDFMPLDQETETCRIEGFVTHPRPIQQHQDFTAIYGMNDRKGIATFQCICMRCASPLDENGFCEVCAGGLPLVICAELQLRRLPPLGTTLGFGLTAEEDATLTSFPKIVLKNRTIRRLSVGQGVHLFGLEDKRLLGKGRVTNITPPPPTTGDALLEYQADIEIAVVRVIF